MTNIWIPVEQHTAHVSDGVECLSAHTETPGEVILTMRSLDDQEDDPGICLCLNAWSEDDFARLTAFVLARLGTKYKVWERTESA